MMEANDAQARSFSEKHSRLTSQHTTDASSAGHLRKLEAMFGRGPSHSATGSLTGSATEASSSSDLLMGRSLTATSHTMNTQTRRPLGRKPSEYRLRLERLRIAREPAEVEEAANTFLTHHQLPDDSDILYKVLLHSDERVLREALGQISALIMQGRIHNSVILVDRLNDLSARTTESSTRTYIEGLREQIRRCISPVA